MTTNPAWAPVDSPTADLLDLLAHTPIPELTPAQEWREFLAYLRMSAALDDGVVRPNRMRSMTRGVIAHQRVGPFYRRACLAGLIAPNGEWETSDDHAGRNGGKPSRCYRWLAPTGDGGAK